MSRIQSLLLRTALGSCVVFVMGCESTGSHATGQGVEYTRQVMSLYNDPAVGHEPRTIEFPINVAVAQIGDAAPQPKFLDTMRSAKNVFAHVESLPAQQIDPANGSQGRDPVRRLESMARDQGADYLLIYGATVDAQTRVNSLAAADLTIVGLFVPGTRNIEATARGSAALIDVRTGTVVLSTGSEAVSAAPTSAVTASADADLQAETAQNDALGKLADQLVASARRREAEQNAIDDQPTTRPTNAVVVQEK